NASPSTPLTNNPPYSGVTTSTLSITNPGITLNGHSYFVIVSQCNSASSTSATLTVSAVPSSPVVTVADSCGYSNLSTTSSGSLLWSTGATTSSIDVTAALNYSVTATVNGCTSAAGTGTATPG